VAFLHPLAISHLWGVGGKTEEQLQRLGLRTIGDLAETPVATLARAIGPAGAQKLHDLAWGIDPRTVETRAAEKSVGHEVTFETDVADPVVLRRELLRLANQVAVRLRRGGVSGRTIALKLRFGDFTTITRSRTIADPTDLGRRIYEEARELYDAVDRAQFDTHGGVRLIGVRVEQLGEGGGSASLWDDDEDWREAENVADAITARFGTTLAPASLLRNTRDRDAEARGFARDA
jgi:DNA polymerase-4